MTKTSSLSLVVLTAFSLAFSSRQVNKSFAEILTENQTIAEQDSDANLAFESQKELVLLCIESGKQVEAETEFLNLVSNYPYNTHMADVIHHEIAAHYRKYNQNDKADEIDQYVIDNWPTTESAMWAQVDITAANINRNNFTAAQEGVNNLFALFADNKHLGDAIHSVAYRYRQTQKTAMADELDQYVLNHWPTTESAMWAQVDLIHSDIDGRNYAFANTGIDKLLVGFAKNENIPNILHGMAYKFRQLGKIVVADELDRYVLDYWPTAEIALWSQVDLIKSGIDDSNDSLANDYTNTLTSDFSNYEQLPYALFQIADRYRMTGKAQKAEQFYKQLINNWPNSNYTLWSQTVTAMINIQMNDSNSADAEIDRLFADFTEEPEWADAILPIAERYYTVALNIREDQQENSKLFWEKSTELVNELAKQDIPDTMLRSNIFYIMGLSYWQLGEYLDAANALTVSVEVNPNHEFAGNIHWLISDCYERLKYAGKIEAEEADEIIEWGYQTLFDNYPNCNLIDHTAIKLGEINMEKGKTIEACAYYCWFLINSDGDEHKRLSYLNRKFGTCGSCDND